MFQPHPAVLASQLTEQGNALAAAGRFEEAAHRYREAIIACPTLAAPHTNLGNIHAQENRLEEAACCHRTAVALDPSFAPAHVNLGNLLVRQGRLEEAFASLTVAERLRPDDAEIPYNLAIAHRKLGQLDIAAACYRRAIERNPSFATAYSNLGVVLTELGLIEDAIRCHRTAVAMGPTVAAFHNNLGNALREQGQIDQAIACHRHAIALQPHDPGLWGNLGNELQELGRFDEAWEAFEAAVNAAPTSGAPYLALANTGRLSSDSPYIARMRALAADMGQLPVEDQIALHFALARVLENDREPAQAFQHLLAGNRLARAGIVYDEAATLAALDATRANYPRARLMTARAPLQSPRPIFIVGMPRSGTTLVEQVLAGHPAVFAAGELPTLPRLVHAHPEENWAKLGAAYLADLRARAPAAASCVTDKLPSNFRYLGMIHLALPHARIIHVRRDRFDTCMSIFARLFTGDIPYAYDLGEIGRYYAAYERLMAHWREALPRGVMIEVEYEALVADLAGQTRRMLGHCGLPWDAACLAFHAHARPVRTASTVQIRQPLYASAVGRWRAVKEAVLF